MSPLDSVRLRRRVLEQRLVQLETQRAEVLTKLSELDAELRELLSASPLQVPLRMDHDDPRDREEVR